ALNELIRKKHKKILLDFSAVMDIDNDAIAFLNKEAKRLQKLGVSFGIQNVQLIHSKINNSNVFNSVVSSLTPRIISVAAGDYLIRQDEEAEGLYIVQFGRFRVTRKVRNKEEDFGEVSSGDVVGEMAVIGGGTRAASVIAVKPSKVFEIKADQIINNEFNIPEWFLTIIKQLINRVREAGRKFDNIIKTSAIEETNISSSDKIEFKVLPPADRTGIFKVNGTFNPVNTAGFESSLYQFLNRGFYNIILDFSNITGMADSYRQPLEKLAADCNRKGGSLQLINTGEGVKAVLRDSGLLVSAAEAYTVKTLSPGNPLAAAGSGIKNKEFLLDFLSGEIARIKTSRMPLSLLYFGPDSFTEQVPGQEDKELLFKKLIDFGLRLFKDIALIASVDKWNLTVCFPCTD
ncbi:MAG TPA: cyclic nucleotide-binding domain-containing protein, partial [Spirochaetota bacterium]|nr:cyclic nucleotide-binding domain-containing protein [Spirochaetota bacterium]